MTNYELIDILNNIGRGEIRQYSGKETGEKSCVGWVIDKEISEGMMMSIICNFAVIEERTVRDEFVQRLLCAGLESIDEKRGIVYWPDMEWPANINEQNELIARRERSYTAVLSWSKKAYEYLSAVTEKNPTNPGWQMLENAPLEVLPRHIKSRTRTPK